jgi:hypothetical protein
MAKGSPQVDPSGPNELAYVYQITSVTAADPGIDTLTVGIDLPDARGGVLAHTLFAAAVLTYRCVQQPLDRGGAQLST